MVKKPVHSCSETGRSFIIRKNGTRLFLCEHLRAPTACNIGECVKKFKHKWRMPCPCGSGLRFKSCRACKTPGAGCRYCPETGVQKERCRCGAKLCGGAFCDHDKRKGTCPLCNPVGHLLDNCRSRMKHALRGSKAMSTIEYLGCTPVEFKEHISTTLQPGMTWENRGEWEIGHRKPVREPGISKEETEARLHYRNTFAQWKADNRSQGNRFHFKKY